MLSLHYAKNPDNPYSWDLKPSELHQLRPYEIIYLDHVRRIIVLFLRLSGALSFVFLYLVIAKTKGEMMQYKPMFMLCAVTDAMFYIGNTMVEYKAKAVDGVFMLKFEGMMGLTSWHTQIVSMGLYIFLLSLAISILPAQFYYRYCILTSDKAMSKTRITFLFSISYSVGIPIGILAYFAYGYSATIRPTFNYGRLWFPERPLPTVIYADIRHPVVKLYFGAAIALISIFYCVVLVIGHRTVKVFNSKTYGICKKSKNTQNQVTYFLVVQGIIPLFISSGPNALLFVICFMRLDPGIFLTIIMDFLGLIPVCNPLLSILVIKPYREAVLRLLGRKTTVYSINSAFEKFHNSKLHLQFIKQQN